MRRSGPQTRPNLRKRREVFALYRSFHRECPDTLAAHARQIQSLLFPPFRHSRAWHHPDNNS